MSEFLYKQLREVSVADHVEKKNGLSYLSWAWAVDQLLLRDPSATWEFKTFNELPFLSFPDGTAMVYCQVTAFGKTHPWIHLPVMDHRNKAITHPDSFAVNTAMQRCLTKAISISTGIGGYLYSGEDLPPSEERDAAVEAARQERVATLTEKMRGCKTVEELGAVWNSMSVEEKQWLGALKEALKATLFSAQPNGTGSAKVASLAVRSGKPSRSSAPDNAPSVA